MTETAKALQAFEDYWALGEQRTHERVARDSGKSVSLINRWSSLHGWQDRIKARIAEQAAAVEAEKVRQLAEVEALLLHDGIEAQRIAMRALKQLAGEDKIPARDAAALLAQARTSMLRGLRQPDSIARQEQTGTNGGPVVFTIEIDSRRGETDAGE